MISRQIIVPRNRNPSAASLYNPLYEARCPKFGMPPRKALLLRNIPFLEIRCRNPCAVGPEAPEPQNTASKNWSDFVQGLSKDPSSESTEAPVKDAMHISTSCSMPAKGSRAGLQSQMAPSRDFGPVFAHPYMPSVA